MAEGSNPNQEVGKRAAASSKNSPPRPDTTTRIALLEEIIGDPTELDDNTLAQCILDLRGLALSQDIQLDKLSTALAENTIALESANAKIVELEKSLAQVLQLSAPVALVAPSTSQSPSVRKKIPEPTVFSGDRNAKVVETFLWDMELFFDAARIPAEEQVSTCAAYLGGDAKLWWRTEVAPIVGLGRSTTMSWEELKAEIKQRFVPENSAWTAMDQLLRLRHTTSIRDYVKSYSCLMMETPRMEVEIRLYHFINGLQYWAQLELKRQKVKDLQAAYVAADTLTDLRGDRPQGPKPRQSTFPSSPPPPPPSQSFKSQRPEWLKKKPFISKRDRPAVSFKPRSDWRKGKKPESSRARGIAGRQKNYSCFICGGPHFMKDCPKRERANTLVVEQDPVPALTMNPMVLNTLSTVAHPLMHVEILLNHHKVIAMVDTGASHLFVADRLVTQLGLRVSTVF